MTHSIDGNLPRPATGIPIQSLIGLVMAAALLAGCASRALDRGETISEEFFSGFLQDYSKLSPSPYRLGNLAWLNPELDLDSYRGFIVDSVVLHVAPALVEAGRPDPDNAIRITRYFHEALIRRLREVSTVTEDPGRGIARLRVAITGTSVERRELEAYQYIPAALVVTGIGEATGYRDKLAVVFAEAEITDSLTGEVVAQTVQQGVAKVPAATQTERVTEAQVKTILEEWASALPDYLTRPTAEE
jgi:hypothetical protein